MSFFASHPSSPARNFSGVILSASSFVICWIIGPPSGFFNPLSPKGGMFLLPWMKTHIFPLLYGRVKPANRPHRHPFSKVLPM